MSSEWVELPTMVDDDNGLTRFVSSFAIDIPFLKSRIADGASLEEFVDKLVLQVHETILDTVKREVEK